MTPRGTRAISRHMDIVIVAMILLMAASTSAQIYTHDQDLHPNATASFVLTANDNSTVIQADYSVFAKPTNLSFQEVDATLLLHGNGSATNNFSLASIKSFCIGYVDLLPRVNDDTQPQCGGQLSSTCQSRLSAVISMMNIGNCSSSEVVSVLQSSDCNSYAGSQAVNNSVALAHTGPFPSGTMYPIEFGNFTTGSYPANGHASAEYNDLVHSSTFLFFIATTSNSDNSTQTSQFNCKNLVVQPGSSSLAGKISFSMTIAVVTALLCGLVFV